MQFLAQKHKKLERAAIGVALSFAMMLGGGALAQTASAATPADCSTTATKAATVKKALDAVKKTSAPTVDAKTNGKTAPLTNFYKSSTYWRQAPLYYNGTLGNPEGTDLVVEGRSIANEYGGIVATQKIRPQHADETILEGDYDGVSAWMFGYSGSEKVYYLYQLDSTGKLVNVFETPAPQSTQFDATWTKTVDYGGGKVVKFYWYNNYLEMDITTPNEPGYIGTIAGPQTISVPVKYVDTLGNEIAPEGKASGYRNNFVDIDVPEIDGYRLVKVPYENADHQYYLSGQAETTPTTGYRQNVISSGRSTFVKVLDKENTLSIYFQVQYSDGTVKTTNPITMSADPYGYEVFTGGALGTNWQLQARPAPIGNPFEFVYEPVDSHKLTVKYVDKTTGKELCAAYTDTGTGSYDITTPSFANYTTDTNEVKGVLTKDTTVTVEYTPTKKPATNVKTPPVVKKPTPNNKPSTDKPKTTTPKTTTPQTKTTTPKTTTPKTTEPKAKTPAPKAKTPTPKANEPKASPKTPAKKPAATTPNGGSATPAAKTPATVISNGGAAPVATAGNGLAHTGTDVTVAAIAVGMFVLLGALASVFTRRHASK